MRNIYALAISLAMLVTAPGLATADTYVGQTGRQQYINYVITRGLAQRGVPYSYGGGNAGGPTLGTVPAPDQSPSVVGTDAGTDVVDPAAATATVSTEPSAKVVGFDASGLVQYAFAGVGIKLPRSSGEQYTVGRKVLPAQALPGDLIFYGPEGTQSVALFLGNGQMLEATTPAVTVSPVRTAGMAPYLTRIIEA